MRLVTRVLVSFMLLAPLQAFAQSQQESLLLRCVPFDDEGRKIANDAPCPKYETTIIQLLARPEVFDGKRVIVRGFVHWEFESSGIYIRREDHDSGLTHNALWIEFAEDAAQIGTCQDAYVTLEGIFRAREYGHRGIWSGTISDVSRCLP